MPSRVMPRSGNPPDLPFNFRWRISPDSQIFKKSTGYQDSPNFQCLEIEQDWDSAVLVLIRILVAGKDA